MNDIVLKKRCLFGFSFYRFSEGGKCRVGESFIIRKLEKGDLGFKWKGCFRLECEFISL